MPQIHCHIDVRFHITDSHISSLNLLTVDGQFAFGDYTQGMMFLFFFFCCAQFWMKLLSLFVDSNPNWRVSFRFSQTYCFAGPSCLCFLHLTCRSVLQGCCTEVWIVRGALSFAIHRECQLLSSRWYILFFCFISLLSYFLFWIPHFSTFL